MIRMQRLFRRGGFALLLLNCFSLVVCSNELKAETTTINSKVGLSGPEQVAEAYCRAVLEGATLSADNYKKSGLASIIIPVEKGTPGWDIVDLVDNLKIKGAESATRLSGEADVSVEYSVLAEWGGAVKLTTKRHNENYVFHLKQVQGTWKIVDPTDLRPHISVKTAIRHMEELIRTQGEAQPEGQRMLSELKALQKSANKRLHTDGGEQRSSN